MNSKIKILHILEASLGGTRRHVIDILRTIDLQRFDVTFCYSTVRADKNFPIDLNEIKNRGVRCIEIPMYRDISLLRDLRSFVEIYRFIKKEKFAIVHAHSSKAGFLGRIAAKLVSWHVKTVYTPNSMPININRLYLYIEKLAVPFTDVIIAVSESEKREIVAAHLTKKIININSGVKIYAEEQRSKKLHKELGISEDKLIVASVGRLTKQKDPLTFFAAVKECIRSYDSVSLFFVWIGDGELRTTVEEFIQENELQQHCRVVGWRTDVDELLWSVDIFVLTSIYESFGYVTCEAMSHFLPVIATNVVGTADIVVNDESGYLVEKGNSTAIAQKILMLDRNQIVREAMGRRGKERIAECFNVTAMVQRTEELYADLLTEKSYLGDTAYRT